MTWYDDTLALARAIGGEAVTGDEGFGPYTITVPAGWWRATLVALRDRRDCTYFDWLSAVDDVGSGQHSDDVGSGQHSDDVGSGQHSDDLVDGFRLVCHVAALPESGGSVNHVVVQTSLPRAAPVIDSLVPVYAGAGWHERETHEMFGIDFTGGVPLEPLLLPDEFEGHPLRKEFVLASRVAKPWPGAKEPGESDHDVAAAGASPSRRRMRPPGSPDSQEWGPREPGSPAPDPLAHARVTAAAARPRRTRRAAAPESNPTDREGGDGDG